MGNGDSPVVNDSSRETTDTREDEGTLSREAWSAAEQSFKDGNKRSSREAELNLGPLDFNTDIYASQKQPLAVDAGTGTAKNHPDGGTDSNPDGGAQPHIELTIGEAVIQPQPHIELEIGEAVIQPQPHIELEIGEAVLVPQPDIEIEIGEPIIEPAGHRHSDRSEPRDLQFRPDGSATYEIQRGDTLREISRDVEVARHPDMSNYRPSGSELDATVQELARHNRIQNPDLIRTGHTLEIPSQVPANVKVNEYGRATDITYPNGSTTHVEYGADHNPSEIRSSDGTWRHEADGWNHYDAANNKTQHLEGGGVSVMGDGTVQVLDGRTEGSVTFPNGEYMVTQADGKGVWRDAAGHPQQVDYPNGRPSTEIHYDSAGNADRVNVGGPGGQEWRKEADGWHQYDKGTRRDGPPDQITVANDGTVTLKGADGDGFTWHPDGETTDTLNGVTTDHGRVTDIHRPTGKNDHLTYDGEGHLTEVRSSDNTYWRSDADGWNQYDANNARVRQLDGGGVRVNEQGGVEVLDRHGTGEVYWPNGGTTEQHADGSGIWRNAAGHPEQVDYPNGRPSTTIHHDSSGNADRVEVGGHGGQEWRKEADGWHQYDKGTRRDGPPDQVDVSTDGTLTLRAADGDVIIWHPNGDATTTFANTAENPN